MSAENDKRRIIVKRHHVARDEDHGGQWKIAYADFVTAMMAFFLVMWLLSSTTEAQRDGIAQFFNASSILDLPAGNGVLSGGTSMLVAGESRTDPLTTVSEGGLRRDSDGGESANNGEAAEAAAAQDGGLRDPIDRQRLEAMKAELERQLGTTDGTLRDFVQNLRVEMTSEGLRLQIFDRDGAPMFAAGATEPTPRLARILHVLGGILATVPNAVVVAGHTDGQAFSRGAYGNWELSSDRANSARRVLEQEGVPAARMHRIEGKSSVEPLLREAPNDPRNRRIAITVMRAGLVTQRAAAEPRR
ncbi:flagellar motor protein MotB [Roseomonas marmotae]|uniref:OmpA family protein n=1 Tax=Roseomonas marmotae TaxID=2768161 RepID=A0ABS3KF38_9PROT|nr:flagellar motor protein MotB [Roseomonas marmotae]MBO1076050.1 OmpA family protein [Roseomonas marmotae]QTI81289.1 OmpA family protein [Roseomonas marmotae]